MNFFTVMSAPEALADFLPHGGMETLGAGRAYRVFNCDGRTENLTFVDPIDGETLVDVHTFESISAANQWIADDIQLRTAATTRVH